MAGSLIAEVKDGVLTQTESATTKKEEKKGTNELGKDAFLQLLVTQMRNQDPLNPDTNTEFVAQLAQFSSLEQMQNMNATLSNTSAFNLMGEYVEISEKDSSGKENNVEGVVEYVLIQKNTAYVSVDGVLHKASDIRTVKGKDYLDKLNAPQVEETRLEYDHVDPKDLKIKVDMGKESGRASAIVVMIGDKAVDTSHLSYDESKKILTISKDAVAAMDAGRYDITLAFDDKLSTTCTDKVKLTVTGSKPEQKPEE